MTGRRKKPAEPAPPLFTEPKVVDVKDGDGSVGVIVPTTYAPAILPTTQLERANVLARAREEGEREGRIAQACEDAGALYYLADEARGTLDKNGCAAIRGAGDGILAALRHRYQGNRDAEARIEYHLKLRSLS